MASRPSSVGQGSTEEAEGVGEPCPFLVGFGAHSSLKLAVDRAYDKILKRWTKKTMAQRKALVLDCFPECPQERYSDIRSWAATFTHDASLEQRDQRLFMLPYLTLEDLTETFTLPHLAHIRAQQHPIDLVKTDTESLRCGIDSGILGTGIESGPMAVLRAVGDNIFISPDLTDVRSGDIQIPIQLAHLAIMYAFRSITILEKWARKVLHDIIDLERLPSVPYCAPIPKLYSPRSFTSALASSAGYNVDALRQMLMVQREVVIDEIRACSTDPGFFYEKLDRARRADKWLYLRTQPTTFQDYFTINHVYQLYRVQVWTELLSACDLHERSPLADGYLESLGSVHLKIASNICLGLDQLLGVYDQTKFPYPGLESQATTVLKLVQFLQKVVDEHPRSIPQVTLFVCQEIAQYPATQPPAQLLDERCVYAVVLHHLNVSVLWPFKYRLWVNKEDNLLQSAERRKHNFISKLMEIVHATNDQLAEQDFNPQRFDYPYQLPHTETNINRMRQSEDNLATLWIQYNTALLRAHNGFFKEFVVGLINEPIQVRRTRAWQGPESIKRAHKKPTVTDADRATLFELCLRTEATLGAGATHHSREKVKTEGNVDHITTSELNDIEDNAEPEPEPEPSVIEVPRRALRTFQCLFFIPSTHNLPGSVSWKEIINALQAAGFIPYKQMGSAWTFVAKESGLRSISFHEPHPSDKVDFHIARHFGRRLTRAYGWTASTFVLAKKTAE